MWLAKINTCYFFFHSFRLPPVQLSIRIYLSNLLLGTQTAQWIYFNIRPNRPFIFRSQLFVTIHNQWLRVFPCRPTLVNPFMDVSKRTTLIVRPWFSSSAWHVLVISLGWFTGWEVSGHTYSVLLGNASIISSKELTSSPISSHISCSPCFS